MQILGKRIDDLLSLSFLHFFLANMNWAKRSEWMQAKCDSAFVDLTPFNFFPQVLHMTKVAWTRKKFHIGDCLQHFFIWTVKKNQKRCQKDDGGTERLLSDHRAPEVTSEVSFYSVCTSRFEFYLLSKLLRNSIYLILTLSFLCIISHTFWLFLCILSVLFRPKEIASCQQKTMKLII